MENLICFRFASLLVTILVHVLPRLALSANTTYTRPEKFYVNCGSDSNVTYGNRTFVGDMISNSNSVSFTSRGTEATTTNQSGIYGSVRIFRQPSSYKFQLDSVGIHFVRLHFSAISEELITSSFTVSATHHFKSIKFQNFNETPRVEEFLLMIDSPVFEIRFEPSSSSVGFVNAIEVFSAPSNAIPLDSGKNLRTLYRLNVGGGKITPEKDTLGRTWLLDDDFIHWKDAAENIRSTEKPNYEGGSSSATEYTAPDLVYQTAKSINMSLTDKGVDGGMMRNLTWSFKVKTKTRHLIRFHFCDIEKNETRNSSSDFYLYVNGHWREDVKPSARPRLVTPFYNDFVNISDGSGLLNVSIGTKNPLHVAGFLNGLEVMEDLDKKSSGSSQLIHIIAGSVAAAVSLLVLGLLFVVFLKRRSKKKKKKKQDVDEVTTMWSPLSLYRGGSSENRPANDASALRNLGLKIPLTDILKATNNFDEKWLIGKGGFGDVYKAVLPDGSKAAIKRGKGGSGQGILEFQTEIQVLSRIRHRHLVSLTGYCEENSEMILVYEFMEKGTLREHLYGSDLPSLTWKQRIEICIGAARGLGYLHSSGSDEAIIHRDVKSTNILLDENNVAKVADFGLSKLAARNQENSNISTNIKGTFGYLDPEYLQTHILTEKSDVYAFGVVLLEVLCARPALDTSLPHEEVNLVEWFMFCRDKGVTNEILDPTLIGQIEQNSLRKFMETAEKCLNEEGGMRPSMEDVKWDLEYVLQLQMATVSREPHEDSGATFSGGSSLVVPRLMMNDSFSSNSIVPMKSSYGGGTTESSESRVFSQLNMSEAR